MWTFSPRIVGSGQRSMSTRPHPRVVSYLRAWSRLAAVFAAAVGMVTLAGAALHSSALSWISAGTGAAFLLAGAAVWLLRDGKEASPTALRYVPPFALLLYAFIALAQGSLGFSVATERSTAACFLLVAAALLAIDLRGRQLGSLSHL